MDDAKRELVQAWLIKSRNDLLAAKGLGGLADAPLDAAIYHCQQAAEKAVKALLAFHNHKLERSHDIGRLVDIAATYEPRLKEFEDAAITLTPYATAYRYHGEAATLQPSREEFDEALRLAEELVSFVNQILPNDVRPPA